MKAKTASPFDDMRAEYDFGSDPASNVTLQRTGDERPPLSVRVGPHTGVTEL